MQIVSSRREFNRRGGIGVIVLIIVALAVVAAVGLAMWNPGDHSASDDGIGDEFIVSRGSFDVVIPASGEMSVMSQVDIRNPLEGRAVITYIVEEGTTVSTGDTLVTFADEDIRNAIKDAELNVLSARNAVTAAENNLAIQESQNGSRLSKGNLNVQLAQLALEQWRDGTVKARREQLRARLEKAERELTRLTEKYQESIKLYEKGHISRDEYKSDEIRKLEAESELSLAKLDIEIYETYEYQIEEKQKLSDLEQAQEELERIKQENEAARISKVDDLTTKKGQLEIRESRLQELQDQLSKCIIKAPQNGLVVYGSSLESGGWRNEQRSAPQIGTELRRNDLIIVLPDVTQMVARVKVHESVSGQIEVGQRATVVSDVLPNTLLRGSVISKGVLAETGSWRDPNRRDYTIRILLEETDGLGLKPSMRCKADILVETVEDALFVPVQAIFRDAGRPFAYVRNGVGYDEREVVLGKSSELYAQIIDGLEEGETVLLREPAPNEVLSKLPAVEKSEASNGGASAERGNSSPNEPDTSRDESSQGSPGGRSGGRGPGGAGGGGMNFQSMFAQSDKNGDGKLTRDELPERMQGFFDRMDANGDGEVEMSELQNMRRPGGGQ